MRSAKVAYYIFVNNYFEIRIQLSSIPADCLAVFVQCGAAALKLGSPREP